MINHCDDDRVLGRALLLAPALLALAFVALGQTPELMPTVKVRPAANAPARTTDCATGLIAASPRLEIEPARPSEMPRAVERATATSRDAAALFRRVQDAAEAEDRTAFKAALESARGGSRSLAPGAQRTRADELVKVYDDIERVWDYSFASRTGAFFSAETQGGTLLAAMSRHPGYSDFIKKQSLVDQANERFYPTRETRAFLSSQSARILLGAPLGSAGTHARAPEAGGAPSGRRPEPKRSSAASPRSQHRDTVVSRGRSAHHSSSARKSSRSPGAHSAAPKSAARTPLSHEGSTASASSARKSESGRGANRSGGDKAHPTSAASAGTRRVDGRRPSATVPEPKSVSSTAARNPKPAPSFPPATAPRGEPATQSVAPPPAGSMTNIPVPALTSSASSTTTATNSPSSSTSASDTSGTTSTISSGTTIGSETTTSGSLPAQRTSEPPVPSGGRTYLSVLMVAIGLIVLIVLIRASK